jgi:hypothetical protein
MKGRFKTCTGTSVSVIAISCQVSSFSVKLHFNELMIELDFYSANSLKQQSTGRHVAPL